MTKAAEQLSLVPDSEIADPAVVAQEAFDRVLASKGVVKPDERQVDDENFDWSWNNEDVLMPEQRQIAVYVNPWGAAVIRQEKRWPDEMEDPYVMIDYAHLPALIEKLQAIAARPQHRAEPEAGQATGGLR